MDKKRVAIFAHFDKDNVIDDYVIFYLESLKSICSKIIFVSACNLSRHELQKIMDTADKIIAESHNEYDFGSYKRGFFNIENINSYDEIIFANDSCYGPVYPLYVVFNEMDNKECDFWGITENLYDIKGNKQRHIQSYFIVVRKPIFSDDKFINFIQNIKPETSKNNIIQNYEVGLSKLLFDNGYIGISYVKQFSEYGNSTIVKWRELLIKNLSPFVKCSLFRLQNVRMTTIAGWQDLFCDKMYNITLIKNNLKRLNIRKINNKRTQKNKENYFNFINNPKNPRMLRKLTNILMKHFYPQIFD